jgi:oligogalacturonide lyase
MGDLPLEPGARAGDGRQRSERGYRPVTEKGYMGMLCVARHSMNLYLMRNMSAPEGPDSQAKKKGVGFRPRGPHAIIEVHLDKIFADSAAGTMGPADSYERVCGIIPDGINAGGNMGLDADEDYVYFSYTGEDVGKSVDVNNPAYSKYIEPGTNRAKPYGPRGMGAGPAGLASMNLKTGEVKPIVAVPFQIGHVQTNPWVHGEIVFCWETGGKAPQRTWTIMADGTGLRPLYPEPDFDWVTHEAVITKDEVAIAIEANTQGRHPNMPPDTPWGPLSATGEHPSGVGVVNLRTREMRIVGQLPFGNPGVTIWHVNGSADGRWAAADDHLYRLWVIDRHNGELLMLADMGHKTTAADHIHPTFSADGTKLEIESAMISPNGQSMNIVVVPMPRSWIARNYGDHAPE